MVENGIAPFSTNTIHAYFNLLILFRCLTHCPSSTFKYIPKTNFKVLILHVSENKTEAKYLENSSVY